MTIKTTNEGRVAAVALAGVGRLAARAELDAHRSVPTDANAKAISAIEGRRD